MLYNPVQPEKRVDLRLVLIKAGGLLVKGCEMSPKTVVPFLQHRWGQSSSVKLWNSASGKCTV